MSSALVTFNNGNKFPLVGFGTWLVNGQETITKTLDEALRVGYRSFDTATMYDNELEIGKALKVLLPKHNLRREDIYLTSKLGPDEQGPRAEETVRRSIKNLQSDYIDLYLIHWPGCGSARNHRSMRRQSWASLVKLQKEGLLKNIGVSNYAVKHLKELINDCDGIKPVLNQIEWHPHNHPEDIYEECKLQNVQLQAYSSLGGAPGKRLLSDPEVKQVAEEIGKPIGQVLLKWAIQRNVAIIPKAVTPSHIRDNFNLDFVIPDELMQKLNNLSVQCKYDWDPETID